MNRPGRRRSHRMLLLLVLGLSTMLGAIACDPPREVVLGDAYERGISAEKNGDWEQAAVEFARAEDYRDAPAHLTAAYKALDAKQAESKPTLPEPTGQSADAAVLAQLGRDPGRFVYTTQSGRRGTLWMVGAGGGQSTELTTGERPATWPPQLYQGPLQVMASTDRQVLLARVLQRSSDSSTAGSAAGTGGSSVGDWVLYAFSPDGTNRREVGRGKNVLLLDEYRSGVDPSQSYEAGVPASAVDRSRTGDGKRLWFAVMSGPSGAYGAYETITWYSWDVEKGTTQELASAKLSAGNQAVLADTTADLSKALFVRQSSSILPFLGSGTVLSVLDPAAGTLREVATVGGASNATLPRLSPDGAKALVLGSSTTLVDVDSGRQTDLQVANTVAGQFSPDGRTLLLCRRLEGQWNGCEAVIVDVDQPSPKTIAGYLFEPVLDSSGPEPFIPGTSLAILAGASQTKQSTLYLIDASSGGIEEIASGALMRFTNLGRSGRLAIFALVLQESAGQADGKAAPGDQTGKDGEGNGPPRAYAGMLLIVDPRALASRLELAGEYSLVAESPDGKRAAAVASDGKLVVLDLTDSVSTEVASAPQISDVRFSPDGAWLAYTRRDGSGASIEVVSVDGARRFSVLQGASLQEWLPAWVG